MYPGAYSHANVSARRDTPRETARLEIHNVNAREARLETPMLNVSYSYRVDAQFLGTPEEAKTRVARLTALEDHGFGNKDNIDSIAKLVGGYN